MIVAVPLPVTAAVIVTVCAKLAVSVSVFEAVKLHGLPVPEQLPPDQPVKRLPDEADSLIEIGSPTNAVQWDWPKQWTRLSVTDALPLPLTAAVIVTVDAAMWAIGPGPPPVASATSAGAGGRANGASAGAPVLDAVWLEPARTWALATRGGAMIGEAAGCGLVAATVRGEPPRRPEPGISECASGAEREDELWTAAGTASTLWALAMTGSLWLPAPPARRNPAVAATAENVVATTITTRRIFLPMNMPCTARKASP
ncbi:MAG TPA: hypothetical protein VN772_00890 [Solirubrobacteraceae bacterium]|nr:hypothetical protein [Solirubrobacteraceae bacterium]